MKNLVVVTTVFGQRGQTDTLNLDKKVNDMKNWVMTLNNVLAKHNGTTSTGKKASDKTRKNRAATLELGFIELDGMNIRLDDVKQFKERHLKALVKKWEASKSVSAATIQDRISVFRTFSKWLGKNGMIKGTDEYVANPENGSRKLAATKSKAWVDQGVDPLLKIDEVKQDDPFVAMQLKLSFAFGLRPKEAMQLDPIASDKGFYLQVVRGTKGGRARNVKIDTELKREVLEQAKALVNTKSGSTIPNKYTLKKWKARYYNILKKNKITRRDGIVSHGLRHQYAIDLYEDKANTLAPVHGGEGHPNPEVESAARLIVAEDMGHSRENITSAYIGAKAKKNRKIYIDGKFRPMIPRELEFK